MNEAPMSDEQLQVRLGVCANYIHGKDLGIPRDRAEAIHEALTEAAQRVVDYAEVQRDVRRLTREIDVSINGDKAAAQASLCDVVACVQLLAQRERNSTELLDRVMRTLAANRAARTGVPLWSVVSRVFAMGSTRAAEMCRAHGLDPDIQVKRTSL